LIEQNILNKKNCIITGATGGIGKALAFYFAAKNCNLFLTGKNKEKIKQLEKNIHNKNPNIKISYCSADLTKKSDMYKIIRNVRKNFQNIDILINCAGLFPVKYLKNSNISDYNSCFNVNVIAPFLFIKEFSEDMKKRRWGRIINIGSSASYNGKEKTSIYRASKHALLGLSRAMTKELREDNIRVFCISPGPTKTKMGKTIVKKENKSEDYNTFIEPVDIAKFICDIVSNNSQMFSQEIRIGRILGEK